MKNIKKRTDNFDELSRETKNALNGWLKEYCPDCNMEEARLILVYRMTFEIESPLRSSYKKRKPQLQALADAVENLDESSRQLIAEVSKSYALNLFKYEDFTQSNIDAMSVCFDNALDIIYKLSYDAIRQPPLNRTAEKNRAIHLITNLKSASNHLRISPTTSRTGAFYKLCQICLKSIGYPHKDPYDLVRDVLKGRIKAMY